MPRRGTIAIPQGIEVADRIASALQITRAQSIELSLEAFERLIRTDPSMMLDRQHMTLEHLLSEVQGVRDSQESVRKSLSQVEALILRLESSQNFAALTSLLRAERP